MKRFSNLLACLLLITQLLYADNYLRQSDIRSTGLGGNEVTQSIEFNPSLLSLYEKRRVSFNYFNFYGIKELGTFSGTILLPNSFLPVGFHIGSFGYEEYQQSLFRFLVSKEIDDAWMIGAAVQYSFLKSVLYEDNSGQLSADIGVTWIPVENLLASVLIANWPSVSVKNESVDIKDFTGYKMQIGFEWLVMNDLLIFLTLEHNNEKSFTGATGIEYLFEENFRLRAGLKASPLSPSVGIGYTYQSFGIDLAAMYHPVLGVSSGIGISWSF